MTAWSNPKPWARPATSETETGPAFADELDGANISLTRLPPTSRQKTSAFAAVAVLFAAAGSAVVYAPKPLPQFAAFIPFIDATVWVTDLITAFLLFAHFSISRSRALLVLAAGYLFTALIAIPHALTFPGAFSPTGLLGAGLQTTGWLYILWHLGFPTSLLVYVWLKDEDETVQRSIASAIGWSIAISVGLVLGFAWLIIVSDPFLPRLFLNVSDLSPLGFYVTYLDLLAAVIALAVLWRYRRSVLDLWLMIVASALISELALASFRFSLGFYVSRIFSFTTSTVVLAVLLAETAGLYTRLALANLLLRRERDNKLMNMAAIVASISHEVKQPLAAMVMRASTALRFLGHSPPEVGKVRAALNKIVNDGHRASEIFNNMRDLFRASEQGFVNVDVNEIVLNTLDIIQWELTEHHITTCVELAPALPSIMGHRGQLQEVFLNLFFNAIEAMDGRHGDRVLGLKSERREGDGIEIRVTDTGPGIDPDSLGTIFDPFVTTKTQGIGLGLAICRMIIERHGGQLLASSAEKGGAQFDIILPLLETSNTSN